MKLTLAESLDKSRALRDHCLTGGSRKSHQTGEDVLWLMGWIDNAIEVELIEAEIREGADSQ